MPLKFPDDGSSSVTRLLLSLADRVSEAVKIGSDSRLQALRAVGRAGRRGLSQIEAAHALGVSGSTLSRLCDELEAAGLIERVAHPTDRRVRTLHLTALGETQVSLCSGVQTGAVTGALADLSDQEVEVLRGLLRRLTPSRKTCRDCEGCTFQSCLAA